MKPLFLLLVVGLLGLCLPAYATEATSGGSIDLVQTWGSLSSQVKGAYSKSVLVDSRINQIILCNKAKKLYAPGPGADGNGCIVNSKIVQLQNNVTTINNQITSINSQITAINTKLTGLDSQISTVQGKVTTLNNQVVGMVALSTQLNAKAADVVNQINDLANRMNAMLAQIAGMYTTANGHGSQIADLYNRVDSINSQIAALNSSIASANADINTINGTVTGLSSNIATILYCGANNAVYNSNSGNCVVPTTHGTCNIVVSSQTYKSTACPGGQYQTSVCTLIDPGNHGSPGSGGANQGAHCVQTQITCFKMACQ